MIFLVRMSEYIYLATKDCSKCLFVTGVSWQKVNTLFILLQFTRVLYKVTLLFYVLLFVFLCSVVNRSFRNRTVDFHV